jgi:hypothetical protein
MEWRHQLIACAAIVVVASAMGALLFFSPHKPTAIVQAGPATSQQVPTSAAPIAPTVPANFDFAFSGGLLACDGTTPYTNFFSGASVGSLDVGAKKFTTKFSSGFNAWGWKDTVKVFASDCTVRDISQVQVGDTVDVFYDATQGNVVLIYDLGSAKRAWVTGGTRMDDAFMGPLYEVKNTTVCGQLITASVIPEQYVKSFFPDRYYFQTIRYPDDQGAVNWDIASGAIRHFGADCKETPFTSLAIGKRVSIYFLLVENKPRQLIAVQELP